MGIATSANDLRIAAESAASLDRVPHAELLQLFATLEAPGLAELDGEYAARPLAAPSRLLAQIGEAGLSNALIGFWIGKAFRGEPDPDAETSQGYNYFRHWGRVVRKLPMLTTVAPSRFDDRPSFQVVYRGFHTVGGVLNGVDEIRRVRPGFYLGFGTMGLTTKQRMTPFPFQLEGPRSPYLGDIGRRREDFDLKRALVA